METTPCERATLPLASSAAAVCVNEQGPSPLTSLQLPLGNCLLHRRCCTSWTTFWRSARSPSSAATPRMPPTATWRRHSTRRLWCWARCGAGSCQVRPGRLALRGAPLAAVGAASWWGCLLRLRGHTSGARQQKSIVPRPLLLLLQATCRPCTATSPSGASAPGGALLHSMLMRTSLQWAQAFLLPVSVRREAALRSEVQHGPL